MEEEFEFFDDDFEDDEVLKIHKSKKPPIHQGGNRTPSRMELEPEWEVLPYFKIYGRVLKKRFNLDINPKSLHCYASYHI